MIGFMESLYYAVWRVGDVFAPGQRSMIRARQPGASGPIYLRVMMYAMTFRKSSSARIIFGMVRWEVRRIAVRAIAVMPGAFATVSNVGAWPLGERGCPAWTA